MTKEREPKKIRGIKAKNPDKVNAEHEMLKAFMSGGI